MKDLGQPVHQAKIEHQVIVGLQETNESFLASLGLKIIGSRRAKEQLIAPVIGLSTEKWTVVDVDNDYGLGSFYRRLASDSLRGAAAYVTTDKGVLVVYPKGSESAIDIDGDIRYERVSRERECYFMFCLSKTTNKPRTMVAIGAPSLQTYQLVEAWNRLAEQSATLGFWGQALKVVEQTAFSYDPTASS